MTISIIILTLTVAQCRAGHSMKAHERISHALFAVSFHGASLAAVSAQNGSHAGRLCDRYLFFFFLPKNPQMLKGILWQSVNISE